MKCPKCSSDDNKVVDTRDAREGMAIRRRRECLECGYRFSTIEEVLREGVYVLKRDGRRERFDREKILGGISKAIEKRPIEAERINRMLADVLYALEKNYDVEIPSQAIGELIMERLKTLDSIAYVRYASVYKQFRDIEELEQDLAALRKERKERG